jgi:hypothetical protein
MRLGGWTRIGIVVSGAWVVIAYFYIAAAEREHLQGLRK